MADVETQISLLLGIVYVGKQNSLQSDSVLVSLHLVQGILWPYHTTIKSYSGKSPVDVCAWTALIFN